MTCASCGVQISWRYAGNEFSCPTCGCGLRLRRRYFRILYVISYGIAVFAAYTLGLREDALFATAILAVLPVFNVVTVLNMRLFPLEVEISGEFRSILHPGEPEDPSLPADPVILGVPRSATSIEEPVVDSGKALFRQLAQPHSIEGWAILLAFLALMVFMFYLAAEPVLYKLLPEFNATKRGPSSFPATVHIGDAALGLSNGSALAWRCELVLGRHGSYRVTVDVDAGATRELAYEEFQANGDEIRTDAETRQTAARQEIALDCRDSAGGAHWWTFD